MLNTASRSPSSRRAVESVPVTRRVVDRFVAGEDFMRRLGAERPAKVALFLRAMSPANGPSAPRTRTPSGQPHPVSAHDR